MDYDFFFLPPIEPEFGKPAPGNGDVFAMFNGADLESMLAEIDKSRPNKRE